MNQYPVIFLTFKDCKGGKDEVLEELYTLLRCEYEKYVERLQNMKDKVLSNKMMQTYHLLEHGQYDKMSLQQTSRALVLLTEYLSKENQKPVILLLDEYDISFLEAYCGEYYGEIKGFLSKLLSRTLKGNPFLHRAVLTGIQRIARALKAGDIEIFQQE